MHGSEKSGKKEMKVHVICLRQHFPNLFDYEVPFSFIQNFILYRVTRVPINTFVQMQTQRYD